MNAGGVLFYLTLGYSRTCVSRVAIARNPGLPVFYAYFWTYFRDGPFAPFVLRLLLLQAAPLFYTRKPFPKSGGGS
jgi:hypothetical protein